MYLLIYKSTNYKATTAAATCSSSSSVRRLSAAVEQSKLLPDPLDIHAVDSVVVIGSTNRGTTVYHN
jgi:hypothetical protein